MEMKAQAFIAFMCLVVTVAVFVLVLIMTELEYMIESVPKDTYSKFKRQFPVTPFNTQSRRLQQYAMLESLNERRNETMSKLKVGSKIKKTSEKKVDPTLKASSHGKMREKDAGSLKARASTYKTYNFVSPSKKKHVEFVNMTISIKEDVATKRINDKCETVFTRIGRKFEERLGNKTVSDFWMTINSTSVTPSEINGTGAILYFRHLHKTGGSTFRHIVHSFTDWTHSFYMPLKKDLDLWFQFFQKNITKSTEIPKFMIEAHHGYSVTQHGQKYFGEQFDKLRSRFGTLGLECPVSILFIREPVSLYISLFRWAVVANTQSKDGRYWWGKGILDWMPDNLLSRILFDPMNFFDRRYIQVRFWDESFDRLYSRGEAQKEEVRVYNRKKHESVIEMLETYDIVAPLQYFDHVLVMLSLLFDWDEIPYYNPDKPTAPVECGKCLGKETDAEICPDMDICKNKVYDIAPYDYIIYNRYLQKFEKQLSYLGQEFEDLVQLYRKELKWRRENKERLGIAGLRSKTNIDFLYKSHYKLNSTDKPYLSKTSNDFGFYCNNRENKTDLMGSGEDCLKAMISKRDGLDIDKAILKRRGYKNLKRIFSGR